MFSEKNMRYLQKRKKKKLETLTSQETDLKSCPKATTFFFMIVKVFCHKSLFVF